MMRLRRLLLLTLIFMQVLMPTGFIGNPTQQTYQAFVSPAFVPPQRFSDNVQLNIDRGLNIINMLSPIHI